MSVYVQPSTVFEATADGAGTGLVGTLTVAIYDGVGAVVTAPATTGIVESPAGSGIYTATRTAPATAGQYVLVWHTASAYASEDLVVLAAPPSFTDQPYVGYVSATAVMALDTGRRYTASSQPNPDQVTQYVAQVAGEIDAVLRRRGYSLPVASTATSARAYLAQGNTLGANAYVELAAPSGSGSRRDDAYRIWKDWLQRVESGSTELDAPKDSTQSSMRSSAGSVPTATFYRGQEF